MKSMRTIAALVAVLGMGSFAQAGLFGHSECGASKCCDCAPTFQPSCCKPTIVRPCHRNVYNYQRSCAKATGCGSGCGPANSCCPTGAGNGCGTGCADGAGNGCGTGCVDGAGNGCVNGATSCAAPCANGNGCANGATSCAAPCATGNGCANGATSCAAPCGNGCANGAGNGCCNTDPGCAAPCGDGCGDSCCATTCQDACEIANLIYTSQTACYARQRRSALVKLGRKYDCVCNPEIMSAFIYGLNDADERVRETAADKIGDELRKNPCCCSQCTVSALTVALADCDRGVRRQAEQALRQCGYDVVDPTCCEVACCDTGCVGNGCAPAAVAPAYSPAAAPAAAPVAPAPPAEPKAYFPKRISDENARPVSATKKSLSNLFGLAR